MTVRIRVRGYQSIADAEIEVSGLTVVTGQNNSGKSALIRAVQGTFTNARGTRFVRNGRDQCTVDVVFSDGRSVTWEKGDGGPCYKVDGKTLNKVGQGVPPEVEALGVVPITAAGRDIWPQFAPQFTGQVFLLDQPGSVLAESIADVTRVGVLNEALRQSQSDRRTSTSELKVRQADVLRLEGIDAGFAGLDSVQTMVTEAETMDAAVDGLQDQVGDARTLRDEHRDLAATTGFLDPVRAMSVPDGVATIQSGMDELEGLRALSGKMSEAVTVLASISPVAGIKVPDVGTKTPRMAEALTILASIRDQMRPLEVIIADGVDLRGVVSVPLPDVDDVRTGVYDLDDSRQLQESIITQTKLVGNLTLEIETVTNNYEQAAHDVDAILDEAGTCPICGRG